MHLPAIITTNLRSIKNKVLYFAQLLDDLQPHVAFVTETWLNSDTRDICLAEIFDNSQHSYNAVSSERPLGKRGGGVLTLVRRDYSASLTQLHIKDPSPPHLAKDNWAPSKLEIVISRTRPPRLPFGYSCCLLVCVYIPEFEPNKQRDSVWQLIIALEDIFSNCTGSNLPLTYIAGDFNGADIKPLCRQFSLKQVNHEPTHRAGKCLDLVLTNAPDCYIAKTRLPVGPPSHADPLDYSSSEEDDLSPPQPTIDAAPILHRLKTSDHCVVHIDAPLHAYKATRPPRRKLLVRTGKISATVNAISHINFDPILSMIRADPTGTISNVYALITAAQDLHQPLRVVKARSDKEWMTMEIKSLIADRQRASTESLRQIMAKRVAVAIRRRKVAFYKARYNCSKASMWKQANGLRAPSTSSPDNDSFAQKLNQQFADKVWEGISKPDLSSYLKHVCSSARHPDFPIGLEIFNCANVSEQFAKIGACGAGPDDVPGKLLRASKNKLVPVFVTIFNHCLARSICPTEWSSANITAIPKVPNASNPADFRPIAITSASCKMFERIIAKFILKQTRAILVNNRQYGFLPGRCTMDAVIQALDHWGSERDLKEGSLLAIFFDFAKAFDLVDHAILLAKLSTMLPTWLVSWIAAYLSNRRQRVLHNKCPTEWKDVLAGVIQGSVLGPVLFLLFISDINTFIPSAAHLLKYADDILAYLLGRPDPSLPQAIVDGVQAWCIINKMRLNTKCKLLAISCSTLLPPPTLNNIPLEYVESYKYLGVELNTDMNPSQQWQRVYSLVNNLPFLLRKLKHTGWSQRMLLTAYRAYGQSHFDYSAVVLYSCSTIEKAEMTQFQRRILKIIGVTPEQAASQHNVLPVLDRIDSICARMFNRIISDPSHPITASLPHNERKPTEFLVPRARTANYAQSFLVSHLRIKRDGRPDLYTNSNASHR